MAVCCTALPLFVCSTAGLAMLFSQGLGHIQLPIWFVTIKNRRPVIVKETVSFFKLFAVSELLIKQ